MKRLSSAAALAALVAIAGPARAQDAAAPEGFTLQHTDPAPAGDRFFFVPDGRVRGLFEVHAAVNRGYAANPVRGLDGPGELVSRQVYGNTDITLALGEGLMLNLNVPDVVLQTGDDGFDREIRGGVLGDLRSTLRINWVGTKSHVFDLATQVDVWYPTGDGDNLAGDSKTHVAPRLSVSGTASVLAYALSGGYHFRPEVAVGDGKVGPGPTFGAAVGLLLFHDTLQIGPEIYGQSAGGSDETPLEALLGLKLRAGNVVLGAGAGLGLSEAPGAAEFRGVLSVAFVRDERVPDPDGDGISRHRDRCPDDPGWADDGCPLPDGDDDTVPDATDACPGERGLPHEDPRKHGCPPAGGPLPPP